MHSRNAWDDYFPVAVYPYSRLYTSRQNPSETSVYVSHCLFNSIISANVNGGALCCTSVLYLFVKSTSFFSCKTNGDVAGAIYFSNNDGQSVLYEVCGYDCYTYICDQFAWIGVKNTLSSKNYLNYSSITRCVNSNIYGDQTMRFLNGNICCPSINISNNDVKYGSAICLDPLSDSNSVTCSLSYSSFADNIANVRTCIFLWTGAKYDVKCCNIIRNRQVDLNAEGTICTNGNVMIKDSCILENIATHVFFQGNYRYTITLSNCTVDLTSNNGYLTTQNAVTKSFIHALNHMATQNCHTEYDTFGTLTPNLQPPSKKQIHYCTCGGLFYHFLQRNFVLLIDLLIFNYIYPYASNGLY
jgi:hypothetical protein